MLAVLVGIINRTNWKKPNTQRGSFSTTVQESEHTQQDKRGRKGQHFAPFLFVSNLSERERKPTTTTHNGTKPQSQESRTRPRAEDESRQGRKPSKEALQMNDFAGETATIL